MMKKLWILLGLIVLALFVVSCAPKEGAEEGALAGEAVKIFSLSCKVSNPNQVISLPEDGGFFSGRGMLLYDADALGKRFTLVDFTFEDSSGIESGKVKDNIMGCGLKKGTPFQLKMCESKQLDWPSDDCENCINKVTIKLVGFSKDGKSALIEFVE